MNQTCIDAAELINSVFRGLALNLQASATDSANGCLIEIDGEDCELLLSQGGELLDAVQHLLTQAFGRSLPKGQRIVCDANNYRAAREAELRAMAGHAARQVRATSSAFTFGPMDASERRIIHLSLADEEDLQTESVGEGTARRLKVSLKSSTK